MNHQMNLRPYKRRPFLWIGLFLVLLAVVSYQAGICQDGGRKIVYHLKLDDLYDGIMANYITRGVEQAEEADADLIIIELDTPGGSVGSMWEINDALLKSTIPTLAWVNRNAASAGSATVVTCENLVVGSASTFGSAVPVIGTTELGPKYISYFRKQMAAAAETNGIYPLLAAGMTDKKLEISYLEYWEWALANSETLREKGHIVSDIPEKIRKYKEMQRNAEAEWDSGKRGGTTKTDDSFETPQVPSIRDLIFGKKDENQGIKPRERDWRDELGDKWFIVAENRVVNLSGKEAIELKVALAEVRSIKEIFELEHYSHLKGAKVVTPITTWSEDLAKMLRPFSGLFLIGGIIGIATELKVPGFGAPGILGIICISLFFFVNFGYDMSEWINVALFVAGIGLLALELFVIPGFGVAGITGIVLMFLGVFLTIIENPMPALFPPVAAFGNAFKWLSIYMTATVVAVILLFRFVLPHTPVYGRIILTSTQDKSKGFHASEGSQLEDGDSLIGKIGTSKSFLRPSGKALFNGKLYDVVTQGDMIDKNETIEIIEVKGNHITVKRARNTSEGDSA